MSDQKFQLTTAAAIYLAAAVLALVMAFARGGAWWAWVAGFVLAGLFCLRRAKR
jgi:hypothetical protein